MIKGSRLCSYIYNSNHANDVMANKSEIVYIRALSRTIDLSSEANLRDGKGLSIHLAW